MEKDQLAQRLMATFLEELQEHVQAFNQDLLALKKASPEAEYGQRLKSLFRTVHSLKGAARSVNVGIIEGACHSLEEILAAVQAGRAVAGPELLSLLFAAADAIEEAGMRLRERHDLAGAPLATLLRRLDSAAQAEASSPLAQRNLQSSRLEPPAATVRAPGGAHAPSVPVPSAPATLAPAVSERRPEPASAASTVRVAAGKLDALFARSGELLVARRRVRARSRDLKSLQEWVGRWKAEWQAVHNDLDKLLHDKLERLSVNGPGGGWPGLATRARARSGPRPLLPALARMSNNVHQLDQDLGRLAAALAADSRALDQAGVALNEEVRRARMLPFAEACQGLKRMAHDLAQAGGKEVDLVLDGGDVEMDRAILEGLKDPLRHLVRNAVDHGAEPAEERRRAGKPPQARITVGAVLRGAHTEVIVADDGRGLDLESLRRQAVKQGLAVPADERELARLIFVPGVSTSGLITDVSGRGVGLDVVKSRVEALHGSVDLAFTPGQGTHFMLAVPLTLTTLRAVLVMAGGQPFAVVGTNVERLVRLDAGEFRWIEGREMVTVGGPPLPVVSLAATLGLDDSERQESAAGIRAKRKLPVLLVTGGGRRMAFVVDEFLAEQEIVVQGLGPRVRRLRLVSGATLFASGQVALVLNMGAVVPSALAGPAGRPLAAAVAKQAQATKKRIVLAEDSVTTRALEKTILEAAGYEVAAAADGAAAWQLLQDGGADVLVSDVEMPRVDGFALTEMVRRTPRFRELPVVLVTARATDEDRARGVAVGANAYLIKSAFDQKNLLEALARLL